MGKVSKRDLLKLIFQIEDHIQKVYDHNIDELESYDIDHLEKASRKCVELRNAIRD